MIIVGLSDIHDDLSRLAGNSEDICNADVVVIAGDMTHFGDRKAAAVVIDELHIYNKNIFAVPGNCDPREVAQYLSGQDINLDRQCKVIGGVAFVGIGGSLPCPGKTPNEISEFEFKELLRAASAGVSKSLPLVLVTHQPPYGTLADLVGNSRHVGSESIREFIDEDQPAVCFCGHIHEACSIDNVNGTVVLNPGPLRRGGYAYVELEGDKVRTAEIRAL